MQRLRQRIAALPIAITLFVLYTLVVLVVGLALFSFLDIATETMVTEKRDGQLNLVEKTTQTKDSVPILAVFTALSAGGWLIIPLKYTWDELGKQAANKREVAAKMRELVFKSIEAHFGPMLYRQLNVSLWAKRYRDKPSPQGCNRLLYSVAQLLDGYDRLRQDGTPLLLRSHKREDDAIAGSRHLQECLYAAFGVRVGEDFLIVQAVLSEQAAPSNPRFVTFDTFERKLGLHPFARVRESFANHVAIKQNLDDLVSCSETAYNSLSVGLDDVYAEWYRDPATLPVAAAAPSSS